MASRRMFSIRLINSARFLKMPISCQALYFHLGLHADDDGIVEAYNVIKTVGCTEDDLRVLVGKGFVQVLNEDLVSYITDWNENNSIRPDRKIDSIYKDLLLSINPEAKLIEKRQRADKKIIDGQPMDNQRTTNGQHRLGKDSIDKVSIDKDSVGKYKSGQQADKGTKPSELTKQFKEMVNESELSDGLKDILNEWIDYKKDIKKPYKTERGFKQLLTIVINHSHNYPDQAIIDTINYSMSNEYQGIVWDKLGKAKPKDFNQSDMSDALSEIENMYMEQVGGSDE